MINVGSMVEVEVLYEKERLLRRIFLHQFSHRTSVVRGVPINPWMLKDG